MLVAHNQNEGGDLFGRPIVKQTKSEPLTQTADKLKPMDRQNYYLQNWFKNNFSTAAGQVTML